MGVCLKNFIHKFISSTWNKKELPQQQKESVIIPDYEKADRTYCSNYRGISLLPTTYKVLSSIPSSRLTPYADEIIGIHHYGF
jgi:hypothetical protein